MQASTRCAIFNRLRKPKLWSAQASYVAFTRFFCTQSSSSFNPIFRELFEAASDLFCKKATCPLLSSRGKGYEKSGFALQFACAYLFPDLL